MARADQRAPSKTFAAAALPLMKPIHELDPIPNNYRALRMGNST
jgi:hypothetical protein